MRGGGRDIDTTDYGCARLEEAEGVEKRKGRKCDWEGSCSEKGLVKHVKESSKGSPTGRKTPGGGGRT